MSSSNINTNTNESDNNIPILATSDDSPNPTEIERDKSPRFKPGLHRELTVEEQQDASLDSMMHRSLAKMQHANDTMIPENYIDQFSSHIFSHPWSRLLVSGGIAWMNFWILAEDPIAHSSMPSQIPIIGQSFALLFTTWPDTAGLILSKFLCGFFGLLLGCLFGKLVVHQRCLRKTFGMFRNDQGSFMVMLWFSFFGVYIFSHIYNSLVVGSKLILFFFFLFFFSFFFLINFFFP